MSEAPQRGYRVVEGGGERIHAELAVLRRAERRYRIGVLLINAGAALSTVFAIGMLKDWLPPPLLGVGIAVLVGGTVLTIQGAHDRLRALTRMASAIEPDPPPPGTDSETGQK